MNRNRSYRISVETGRIILICLVLFLSLVMNPLQHRHPTRLLNDDNCLAAVMDAILSGSQAAKPVVFPLITEPQKYLFELIEFGVSSPGEYSPVDNRAPPFL